LQSWRLDQSAGFGGVVGHRSAWWISLTIQSAKPNKKASDLISFDAFADDEAPLSGHGGLSLPSDTSNQASSSSDLAGLSSSGLPLDLFSAPSPSPSPALLGTGASGRQDPMAFFRNQPQQTVQPSYGGMGGISGLGQSQPPPLQQQSSFGGFNAAPGYSLTPQTAPPIQPTQPIQPPQQQTRTNGTGQQAGKKDAFADLVDLMG
jgi:ADP-ribosylation factor-binding protein GGA